MTEKQNVLAMSELSIIRNYMLFTAANIYTCFILDHRICYRRSACLGSADTEKLEC